MLVYGFNIVFLLFNFNFFGFGGLVLLLWSSFFLFIFFFFNSLDICLHFFHHFFYGIVGLCLFDR